jgi:2-haloacid dehalogenase
VSDVSAIVFDLGGVLIDWDPRHLYRSMFDDADEMEAFLGSVCTMDWHYQHDLGRPMTETLPELAAQWPQHRTKIMAWAREDEMIAGAIQPAVEILEDLHDRSIPCFALTNWPEDSFTSVRDRFSFLAWFDGIVVSGAEGIAKPDPAIFRLLLERYQLDPASTLFIDDTPANVAAARAIGMRAHRFTNGATLALELTALGVLTPIPGAAEATATSKCSPRVRRQSLPS